MNACRRLLAIAILAAVLALAEGQNMLKQSQPSFSGAVGWLNSKPLTLSELRGKVVLVEFWTYTCVNWLRTLPYVRAWHQKYRDKGLVVVGVHTPEFSFEKNVDNIRGAIGKMRIEYPVAIDSNYAIWNEFNNEYWPAMYFIDAQGRIRHHQFGEGDYKQSERVIQHLLAEAGNRTAGNGFVSVDPRGLEVAADWNDVRSPENFLGYARTEKFASPGGIVMDKRHAYGAPAQWRLNSWGLSGEWTFENEGVVPDLPGARIEYRFHARDVNLVMGPRSRGSSVRFRVLLDGKPPGAAHGGDIDANGYGTVSEQRTYQLIRQPKPIADRQFAIEFLDAGVEAFDFTFG